MTYIYTLFNNIACDVSGRQKLGLVFEKNFGHEIIFSSDWVCQKLAVQVRLFLQKYFLPPKNFNKWNQFGFETFFSSSGRVFGYPTHITSTQQLFFSSEKHTCDWLMYAQKLPYDLYR